MGARFEKFVVDMLPSLGLYPKAVRYKIYREGVEVGEIDILATDEKGELYAVEVKAGKVDITGIRQAYVNAKLVGAKPLVIARGYADEGAKLLAEELNVDVILLPDYIYLSIDDLYNALSNAIARILLVILSVLTSLDQSEIEALESCQDIQCVCQKIDCQNLFNKLPKETKNFDLLLTAIKIRKLLVHLYNRVARE